MDDNKAVTIIKLITRINILRQFLKAELISELEYEITKHELEKKYTNANRAFLNMQSI